MMRSCQVQVRRRVNMKGKTTNGKAQSTAKKGKRKREDGGSCGG